MKQDGVLAELFIYREAVYWLIENYLIRTLMILMIYNINMNLVKDKNDRKSRLRNYFYD